MLAQVVYIAHTPLCWWYMRNIHHLANNQANTAQAYFYSLKVRTSQNHKHLMAELGGSYICGIHQVAMIHIIYTLIDAIFSSVYVVVYM